MEIQLEAVEEARLEPEMLRAVRDFIEGEPSALPDGESDSSGVAPEESDGEGG